MIKGFLINDFELEWQIPLTNFGYGQYTNDTNVTDVHI